MNEKDLLSAFGDIDDEYAEHAMRLVMAATQSGTTGRNKKRWRLWSGAVAVAAAALFAAVLILPYIQNILKDQSNQAEVTSEQPETLPVAESSVKWGEVTAYYGFEGLLESPGILLLYAGKSDGKVSSLYLPGNFSFFAADHSIPLRDILDDPSEELVRSLQDLIGTVYETKKLDRESIVELLNKACEDGLEGNLCPNGDEFLVSIDAVPTEEEKISILSKGLIAAWQVQSGTADLSYNACIVHPNEYPDSINAQTLGLIDLETPGLNASEDVYYLVPGNRELLQDRIKLYFFNGEE